MTRRYARSSAEAHLYMDRQPCVCGESAFERHAAVISDGDALCSRYAGTCQRCGVPRTFVFELPDAVQPVSARLAYGGDEPSRLLDPGEWLEIADEHAARTPATLRDRAIARAALEEVMKFLPPGAERIPDDVFFTDRGRALLSAAPDRLARDQLEAQLAIYRDRDVSDKRVVAGDPHRAGSGDADDGPDDDDEVTTESTIEPVDPRAVPDLIGALAEAVVRQEGFTGNDLRRHATDLAGQLHTFVHMYQIQAREELTRRESTAEIEQLLDTIVRTGTPIGAAVAARRDDIVDAFRQVGIAEISRGIQVLMHWMRDPSAEHRAPVEQLLAELQASMGGSPGGIAEAEASLRRIDRSVRASLDVFGQARPSRPRRS
jgi:hypothetical protein